MRCLSGAINLKARARKPRRDILRQTARSQYIASNPTYEYGPLNRSGGIADGPRHARNGSYSSGFRPAMFCSRTGVLAHKAGFRCYCLTISLRT